MVAAQHRLRENFQVQMIRSKALLWIIPPLALFGLGWCFQQHQQKMVDAFLEYVLIRNGGAYVLDGSKPVIEFELTGTNYSLPCFSRNAPYHLNRSRKMWQFWKDIETRKLKNPNFCFVERTAFPSCVLSHFFINRKAITEILTIHCNAFSQVAGFSSPTQLAYDFENENSTFWNTVLQDHYFLGLLFGYGAENSDYYAHSECTDKSVDISYIQALIKTHVDLTDLPIPHFRYPESDRQMVDFYENAKSQILQNYRKKSFIASVKDAFLDTGD